MPDVILSRLQVHHPSPSDVEEDGSLLVREPQDTFANGLSLSGVEPFYRFIAVGLLLIAAVVADQLFHDML